MFSSATRAVVALVFLFLSATAAGAAVHVVDCNAGPFFTINSAVAGALAGDTVVVHPCIYNESVLISSLNDVHLVAAQSGIAFGAYAVGVGASPLPDVIVDSSGTAGPCFRVTLSTDISITGFGMLSCDGSGIWSDNGTGYKFHGNRIHGTLHHGILDNASGTTITGNYITHSGSSGIHLEIGTSAYAADNRIRESNDRGIYAFAGGQNRIINNEVRNNLGEGIEVDATGNRVERNLCVGNGGAAQLLVASGSTNADVVGNDCDQVLDLGTGSDLADN